MTKKYSLALTKPEAIHLYSFLDQNELEGSYSGNRIQYWKRHARIVEKLSRISHEIYMKWHREDA